MRGSGIAALVLGLVACTRPAPAERSSASSEPVHSASVATADPAPTAPLSPPVGAEATAFTARFVQYVRRTHPEVQIEAAGELAVRSGGDPPLMLANLWHECTTLGGSCDPAMERWARVFARSVLGDGGAGVGGELRASLFRADDLASTTVVRRAWVGPLVEALVLSSRDTIGTLSRQDLGGLRMTEEEAWQRAYANLRAALPRHIEGHPFLPESSIRVGSFTDDSGVVDSFGAARLLLHERWAEVAGTGTLLVAAPARDIAIWVTIPTVRDGRALRWLAQQMLAHEPYPISPAVFRWTPKTWLLEDANDKPVLGGPLDR